MQEACAISAVPPEKSKQNGESFGNWTCKCKKYGNLCEVYFQIKNSERRFSRVSAPWLEGQPPAGTGPSCVFFVSTTHTFCALCDSLCFYNVQQWFIVFVWVEVNESAGPLISLRFPCGNSFSVFSLNSLYEIIVLNESTIFTIVCKAHFRSDRSGYIRQCGLCHKCQWSSFQNGHDSADRTSSSSTTLPALTRVPLSLLLGN